MRLKNFCFGSPRRAALGPKLPLTPCFESLGQLSAPFWTQRLSPSDAGQNLSQMGFQKVLWGGGWGGQLPKLTKGWQRKISVQQGQLLGTPKDAEELLRPQHQLQSRE
mmetsp:Transcript_69193/g.111551  ORF Transcript_69193/g.111551 Transcript_69193/m.111551 type:complete len:108 (+) Transcript_69193:176-499(+)